MERNTGEIKQSFVFFGVWKSKSQREGNVMLSFRCNSLTFLGTLVCFIEENKCRDICLDLKKSYIGRRRKQ